MGFGRQLDFGSCDLVAESSPDQREDRPTAQACWVGSEVGRLTDSRAYLLNCRIVGPRNSKLGKFLSEILPSISVSSFKPLLCCCPIKHSLLTLLFKSFFSEHSL